MKELVNLAKKYNLDLFVLFGSRAKNTHKKSSDYDLAFFKRNISHREQLELFDELEEIFKEKSFDLINLQTNHSVVLKQEIFQFGKCLYEKKKALLKKKKK